MKLIVFDKPFKLPSPMMQMLSLVVALSVISQKALGIMLAAALRRYKLKFDSRPENQLNIKK